MKKNVYSRCCLRSFRWKHMFSEKLVMASFIFSVLQVGGSSSLRADTKLMDSPSSVFLQNREIKGLVQDEMGQPMSGVSVLVKGTNTGTSTGEDGTYTIEASKGNTLVFSSVGYLSQEIIVVDDNSITVNLKVDAAGLEEVVVVGYGTQKKVNVVGSVTAVSGEKIADIPAPNVSNAISGKLSGATFTQTSGEPGQDNANIMIRGRSTLGDATGPLVVIDGVPGRSLNDVDPVDIENISLLKDASAAIYGSSAANGVILVTTKRGRSEYPRLTYQLYQGIMTPTVLPKTTNAGDYATMLSEYQDYEKTSRTFSDDDIELFYNGRDPWEHPNSDWVNDLVKKWNNNSKHNITFDGGYNGMQYYVSAGYKNQEAIYKQESTNYKQYNVRAKLQVPFTSWLDASLDYAGYLNNKLYPTKSAGDIYGQSTRLVPTQWSFWPNGMPGPDIEYGDNPVVTSTLETGYDDAKDYKNQFTFRTNIKPEFVEGLTVSGAFSYDVDNAYRKRFQKPWLLYFPQWSTATRNSEGFITDMELTPTPRGVSAPELTEYYDRFIRKLGIISAQYDKQIDDHDFSIFAAYEQLTQNGNNFNAFRKYYISDLVQSLDAGADMDKDNEGTLDIYARKSWIGRLNYSYQGKYLAEVLFRRDGSLKFPPNSRWGNFPAFLLGWRVSEENFWADNISFINDFKLRASYGKIGMDPGDPFQYVNKYVLAKGMVFSTDKVVETVVQQSGVANPNITWEKQTTSNIGFDAQLFDNLISLSTEVFHNKREDILAPRDASVPGFTGLELPDENIARVDNKGFEIELGFHKQVSDDFRFDITGNYSYNKNKVVFMDEPERAVPWQQRTGHPFGAELLYNAIGVFRDQAHVDSYPHWAGAKPGDVIFEDVNGDGKIDSDDRILFYKTDAPQSFYGLTFDGSWKNWSFSVMIQGQGEYYRMNTDDERRGEAGNYFQWQFDDRWTPGNTDTDVARAYNRNDLYWAFARNNSTYWWSDMAYARLKNLTVNYRIPKHVFESIGISSANVFFSGNNLLLIYAAQKNFDPEIGNPMSYPAVKTFAVGAKVTF